MASAAANSAMGTEILAVQRLFYGHYAERDYVYFPSVL